VHAFHTISVLYQVWLFDERGQSLITTPFYGNSGTKFQKMKRRVIRAPLFVDHIGAQRTARPTF
jgi:hypothetical protein